MDTRIGPCELGSLHFPFQEEGWGKNLFSILQQIHIALTTTSDIVTLFREIFSSYCGKQAVHLITLCEGKATKALRVGRGIALPNLRPRH